MRYNAAQGDPQKLIVASAQAGARLDAFLATAVDGASRSFLKRLITDGLVQLRGSPGKASSRVRAGDEVTVFLPEIVELSAEPEAMNLDILFEDEHLIVLNKAAGVVVHPSPGHESGTLVNGLLHHCNDLSGIGGVLRPGIVHRLDRYTTGCLVAAKTDAAHQELSAQFAERRVDKTYLAITAGVPTPPEGKVQVQMGRHPRHRALQAVLNKGGRHSYTEYRTLERFGTHALVECHILTGRTHQIRVHMKHLHAPVLCDREYGRAEPYVGQGGEVLLSRQALHARTLALFHPLTLERMEFSADLPGDMQDVLSDLQTLSP